MIPFVDTINRFLLLGVAWCRIVKCRVNIDTVRTGYCCAFLGAAYAFGFRDGRSTGLVFRVSTCVSQEA